MSRIDRLERKIEDLETTKNFAKQKKKFKMPSSKIKRMFKQAEKKPDVVVVQYLNQKYQVKWMLCRVVSGNIVVVDNKVHTLNPKAMWRYGKYLWYILREIDRKPVSNLDYNKIRDRRDDTEADVPLIKAVLGAIQKKKGLEMNKGWIIWIIIAIVVGIIIYSFMA